MSNSSTVGKGGGGLFYGWVIVAACFFIATIIYGAVFSFGVFLTPFRETFGWTSAVTSGAYSVSMLVYTSFGILAGWGVDKFGPKITIMIGGLVLGVGFLLASQVNSIWQLYLTYGLIGIGFSSGYTPLMTTVSRWFTNRRGLALGIYSTGFGAGPLITAPLASYLIYTSGWRFTFLVIASVMGLMVVAALFLRRSPGETGGFTSSKTHNINVSPPKTKVSRVASEISEFSLKESINTRAFWLISSMSLMVGTALQMVIVHIVAYSEGMGISPLTAAAVLSTISGSSIVGRIFMGMTSDRIGRKKVLAICLFIEGAMIFWLVGSTSAWAPFLFGVVFGFCYGGHSPQFPALVGETFGFRHMGLILGTISVFWGIGAAVGPVLAGHILDTTGSYTSAFIIGAVAMLSAGAITLFLKMPEKRKAA